jgi:hypothetical protein
MNPKSSKTDIKRLEQPCILVTSTVITMIRNKSKTEIIIFILDEYFCEKLVSVSRAASRATAATGSVRRHLRRRKAAGLIGKQVFEIGTWGPLARLASV